MDITKIYAILSIWMLFANISFTVPEVAVTISKSRSGPVYAGTEFVLTADISLSGVNGKISLKATWSRGNDVIVGDSRTTVTASAVSGSGDNYTASLTYLPITISDCGQITATVTVSSMHVYLTATGTENLNVQSMHTCTSNKLIITCCM